ncbi:DNA-binding GntR family transcriptional regulator [Stackebrandtia endophytica]|uniref:DNA-binding GntR family transcriptional regulator n=1 Tax=Stackebrandtia endophytica TaxID=1496996 RepID=A0A543AW10_9ACTN|nr:GntR family transcriptional regulator [Stackebrandtia endophytica]TQL76744.1 DNA-binding GntR family transcriptional regulator [Stackebrandtia endophytica]
MTDDVSTVLEQLRRGIIVGELPPGARLAERSVAAEYGVTRLTVQAAIRRLGQEGFVRRGPKGIAEVVAFIDDDLADIYEMRLLFYTLAVRLAAVRLSPAELEMMQGHQRDSRTLWRSGEPQAAMAAAMEIRDETIRLSGNPMLIEVLRILRRRHTEQLPVPEMIEKIIEGNGEIVDAYLARDPDAAQATLHAQYAAAWDLHRKSVAVRLTSQSDEQLLGEVTPPRQRGDEFTGEQPEAERIADQLREQIILGRLPAGAAVRERPIAAESQLSRTPVRQAVAGLIGEGLMVPGGPKTPARVASFPPEEQEQVADVAHAMDGFVARAAAERRSEAHLAALRATCHRSLIAMRENDRDAAIMSALRFRDQLVAATENTIAETIHRVLRSRVSRWFATNRDVEDLVRQQLVLVHAVSSRDGGFAERISAKVRLGPVWWSCTGPLD